MNFYALACGDPDSLNRDKAGLITFTFEAVYPPVKHMSMGCSECQGVCTFMEDSQPLHC